MQIYNQLIQNRKALRLALCARRNACTLCREAEKSAGQMLQEECSKVINLIKDRMKFDNNIEAFAAIAGLCQVGATNRKAGKNISYVYKGKRVSAAPVFTGYGFTKSVLRCKKK